MKTENELGGTLTTEDKVEALAGVLAKNTSAVKKDRAIEIAELIEVELKRKVEDLERKLKLSTRRTQSSLDLSPDNTYTIMKVKDFDPTEFVEEYVNLQLQIREIKVELNAARESYNTIFGHTYTLEDIK